MDMGAASFERGSPFYCHVVVGRLKTEVDRLEVSDVRINPALRWFIALASPTFARHTR